MPSPSFENLDDFLQLDDFATSATIQLLDGSVRTVIGIFDDPYVHARLGGYDRDTGRPTLTLKESDTVGVGPRCTVTVAGKEYGVLTEPQGDGTGIAIIEMAVL